MTIPITVGICAYNEEANIERTLRSLFSQESGVYSVDSVIVVSSGSTDRTDSIVESMIPEFPRIRLIRQEKREGKNSAINLILREKGTEIVVLLNADNILGSPDSLNRLIEPFSDPKVGVVGGHPVPVNDRDTVAGFTSHLVWAMHHHVSQMSPKIGELMAFRDIGKGLPTDMQSDEDILRMDLEQAGYRSVYAEGALVLNRGPENLRDFFKQRVRVNIGELYMKKCFRYRIPTHDYRKLYAAMLQSIKDVGFHPVKLTIAVLMELTTRLYALAYVKADKGDMSVWDRVDSTKIV